MLLQQPLLDGKERRVISLGPPAFSTWSLSFGAVLNAASRAAAEVCWDLAAARAARVQKGVLVCSELFHGRGTVVCLTLTDANREGVGDGKGWRRQLGLLFCL